MIQSAQVVGLALAIRLSFNYHLVSAWLRCYTMLHAEWRRKHCACDKLPLVSPLIDPRVRNWAFAKMNTASFVEKARVCSNRCIAKVADSNLRTKHSKLQTVAGKVTDEKSGRIFDALFISGRRR